MHPAVGGIALLEGVAAFVAKFPLPAVSVDDADSLYCEVFARELTFECHWEYR